MTRILLHPVFLDLIFSNTLLDRISKRKLTDINGDTSFMNNNGPVWLSEDDLCNMWKVVLKSKLYKTKNGYRMENLAWRLWFYARRRNETESKPVSVTIKPDRANLGDSISGWSPKDIPSRSMLPAETFGNRKEEETQSNKNTMMGVPVRSSRALPSKSFVAMHEFSLLKLESSSSESEEEEAEEPLDTSILNPNVNQANRASLSRRKSAKKKKDVDRYLQEHAHAYEHIMIEQSNTSASTMETEPDIIKPSPDLRRVGVPARRVSRGFSIPSKKSGSSISAESPRTIYSSVSSDDALQMMEKELNRPNIHVPSATYKPRRPSFSRSASPQVSRTPVSMLTILMSGQLTTTESGKRHMSPPSRPAAPIQMIAEEAEPVDPRLNQGLEQFVTPKGSEIRRPQVRNGRSPTTHQHKEFHPHLPIW